MTLENQREDLTREPIDPPMKELSNNLNNNRTEPVSATENEIASSDEANGEPLDLQSEDIEPEEEQKTEQTAPGNEMPTSAEPVSQKTSKGGILLKPLHLLIGSFFIVALVTCGVLFGMWLVGHDRDPDIEDNVKDYHDIYASAEDVAAGNYTAPGYSEVTLPAGKRDVQIILPNPKGNPCYFRYTLVLKDTGEVLYQSGLIEPGKAVTDIRLSRPLEVGDYILKLQIEAFSLEERAAMNGINMEVDLKVR